MDRARIAILVAVFVSVCQQGFSENVIDRIEGYGISAKIDHRSIGGTDSYCLRIDNQATSQKYETDWFSSTPEPNLEWLGDKWLAMFGGSAAAPDCFVVIFDGNTGRLSKRISLDKCIDIRNEMVLIVEQSSIYLQSIFAKSRIEVPIPKNVIKVPNLWSAVRTDSKIVGTKLFLSYINHYDFEKNQTGSAIQVTDLGSRLKP